MRTVEQQNIMAKLARANMMSAMVSALPLLRFAEKAIHARRSGAIALQIPNFVVLQVLMLTI